MVKKSILVLAHSPNIGGAELALASLIESTKETYDWSIVFPVKSVRPNKKLTKNISGIYRLELPWWCYEGHEQPKKQNKSEILKNIKKLSKIASKHDVLLTNTLTIPWLGFVANELNKPHIWYVHEFGDIDHKLEFYAGYNKSLQIISALSSRVMTISNAVSEHLQQNIPRNQIDIIHQSLDLENLPLIHHDFTKELKLLMLGAIKPSKGQVLAIQAFNKIDPEVKRSASLDIIGPNANDQYTKELLHLSHDDASIIVQPRNFSPAEELKTHNTLIMASENEALGRVTLEGLASGLMVIGYSSPSTKDLLGDSRGVLYTPNTPDKLAQAINELGNFNNRFNPADNRAYVEKVYGTEAQSRDFRNCLENALSSKNDIVLKDPLDKYIATLEAKGLFLSRKEELSKSIKNIFRLILPVRFRKILRSFTSSLNILSPFL